MQRTLAKILFFVYNTQLSKYTLCQTNKKIIIMDKKKFHSRKLTKAESAFSKTLTVPLLRKEYVMRLNEGECLENMEDEFTRRLAEALEAQRQAALEEKRRQEYDQQIIADLNAAREDPGNLELLEKAMQVPYDADIWTKQIKHLCDLYVSKKDSETAVFQHAIGYRFLDQSAELRNFFNGLTMEFIFMGGYFTSSSWLLLTKHRKLIKQQGLDGRATHLLKNMFYTLCRKEGFLPSRKEYEAHEPDMMRVVNQLYEKSLTRGLYTEEKNILNVYNLLQVFA